MPLAYCQPGDGATITQLVEWLRNQARTNSLMRPPHCGGYTVNRTGQHVWYLDDAVSRLGEIPGNHFSDLRIIPDESESLSGMNDLLMLTRVTAVAVAGPDQHAHGGPLDYPPPQGVE